MPHIHALPATGSEYAQYFSSHKALQYTFYCTKSQRLLSFIKKLQIPPPLILAAVSMGILWLWYDNPQYDNAAHQLFL